MPKFHSTQYDIIHYRTNTPRSQLKHHITYKSHTPHSTNDEQLLYDVSPLHSLHHCSTDSTISYIPKSTAFHCHLIPCSTPYWSWNLSSIQHPLEVSLNQWIATHLILTLWPGSGPYTVRGTNASRKWITLCPTSRNEYRSP